MAGIVIPLSFPTLQRRLQSCHSGGADNRPVNQSRTHYWSKGCTAPLLVSITTFQHFVHPHSMISRMGFFKGIIGNKNMLEQKALMENICKKKGFIRLQRLV